MTPYEKSFCTICKTSIRYSRSPTAVLSRANDAITVAARAHCYVALRRRRLSYPVIGRLMGRDQKAVWHGVNILLNGVR